MRFLSFKLLAACILLPPLLYIVSIHVIEQQAQKRFAKDIEEAYLGDTRRLLDGSIALKDAIKSNIERYGTGQLLIRAGVSLRVTVVSKSGRILYPAFFEGGEPNPHSADPTAVAIDNFSLLNDGLVVQADAAVEHNRPLANTLLSILVSVALITLFLHFRSTKNRLMSEDAARIGQIEKLQQLERENSRNLEKLSAERESLRTDLAFLKSAHEKQRSQAVQNEDDLIEEIALLESRLNENELRERSQLEEMEGLREKITEFEREQRRDEKYRLKSENEVRKRFSSLYKNLVIHERAVAGFVELGEELKLKAEEVIQQLNHAPDLVPVKRKVFGKKNRETVLEVAFAYKGRLYFRRGVDRRVEILAVGTKNSQTRELEFLSSL